MISIIVAMTQKEVIGREGGLPWPRLSGDLPRFKRITMGHPIIMGRKTFDSLPQKEPLEGRTNIIISSNPSRIRKGIPVNSFAAAVKIAQESEGSEEIFVIGGESIYKIALPSAQKIYLTSVLVDFPGDTFFPISPERDQEWEEEKVSEPSEEGILYQFKILKRVSFDKVVDLTYAKNPEYLKILRTIELDKKCPFCPDNFKYHTKPILKQSGNWFITKNFNPYENSDHHFIILSNKHFEHLIEVDNSDFAHILELAKWAVNEFNLKGGALCMRFGDTTHTGATVCHFHAHLIVPKISLDSGRAVTVNFPIG